MSDPAAAAAFFDLDRTLISGSSVFVFAVEAWRAGVVPTSEIVGATAEALAFRMVGATDERSDEVRMRLLAKVEGASVEELDAVARTVLPKLVERVRPESRGLLKMHADAGRDTWIVSASPQAIIEPLAEALAMTGGIGTKAVVADGRYTSELDGSFVYGQGKAEAIQKLVAERGYDLGRSYAYSDSASDLPMMDLVGHPVAVNPDGPLRGCCPRPGMAHRRLRPQDQARHRPRHGHGRRRDGRRNRLRPRPETRPSGRTGRDRGSALGAIRPGAQRPATGRNPRLELPTAPTPPVGGGRTAHSQRCESRRSISVGSWPAPYPLLRSGFLPLACGWLPSAVFRL